MRDYGNITGIVILKNGETLHENYFNECTANSRIHVYSDMAKIGQLYLSNGIWNHKQIVSAKWIDESTREHSRWEAQGLSYGYLWWINEDGFAAMGDGGNTIYVNTKRNMVISIASLFRPKVKDRMELIREYIEQLFDGSV